MVKKVFVWTIVLLLCSSSAQASWFSWGTPSPTPATVITVAATPTPPPVTTPTPTPRHPIFESPEVPELSPPGENLVIEYEVGGRSDYNQHPEAPDARYSGITQGIGYDDSQNAPAVIIEDWQSLGATNAQRLASTHPYTGRSAQAHLHEVQTIIVPWMSAFEVFNKIDVAREWTRAERAMPGFEDLRPNAQAALISLGFNRGWSMTGDNRREMRAIRDAVPKKDYPEIASQLRKMIRVWTGTSIFNGMKRRRFAEAVLVETP